MNLRFGSVCSGIEAASLAFRPLGWEAAWFSEIEPFPSAVLAHHYPEVPNLGDMTALPEAVRSGRVEAPDVFCGGTPCQAFSVAGNRESLADARGNLTLTFCEIADAIDDVRLVRGDEPCTIFWENVPGVLSTRDNAFGCFLGQLVGAGAALIPGRNQRWTDAGVVAGPRRVAAWRVLDAQHFGLAQRRRRVFVVAGARAGFDPAAVLLERQGLRGHPAARRRARQDATACTLRSTDGGSDVDHARAGHLIDVAHTLRGQGFDASEDGTGRGTPLVPVALDTYNQTVSDKAQTLCSRGDTPGGNAHLVPAVLAFGGNNTAGPIDVATACNAHGGSGRMDFESETFIAFDPTQVTSATNRSNPPPGDPCHTLAKGQHAPAVAFNARQDPDSWVKRTGPLDTDGATQAVLTAGVRRLTPEECEALQGFPRGFTRISWRGKPAEECPDGPRYKSIGNSWAVDCVAWIGDRLDAHLTQLDMKEAA
jgi:DNA (cytosine-5)-methyltransferase 1